MRGLVTEALGRLPVPGDAVTIGEYEFEVERVKDRVAESVLAHPVVTQPAGEDE